MRPRQTLPRLWLMTDERIGAALLPALSRLPRGAGVIFRHYGLAPAARQALFRQVRAVARARRQVLLLAGPPRLAISWGAAGAHGPSPHRRTARPLLRTMAVHDRRQLHAARRADLRFVSPVFPTRSHPGAPALGPVRLGLLLGAERRAIALGGMSPAHARRLRPLGLAGWAAIDALAGMTAAAGGATG
ncbi:thiamine phosphate synthase [Sphingomonas morindae]|uniref:Thiamine phosphate synthase n=1 Tax=Sphingomonas morindae TaxID=1541170 RepID=A0ABY4XBA7_9SPHN|nr:thiamine phosphate synthase [Sphingomonas morindae]USI74232.1 thiamine phosphate synthase [Sphingomonas morindae]